MPYRLSSAPTMAWLASPSSNPSDTVILGLAVCATDGAAEAKVTAVAVKSAQITPRSLTTHPKVEFACRTVCHRPIGHVPTIPDLYDESQLPQAFPRKPPL